MTASNSSSDMLKSIRSRKIPATHTAPSIRPKFSTQVLTMCLPPSQVATLSATATASPPAFVISLTTPSGDLAGRVLPSKTDSEVCDDDLGTLGGASDGYCPTDAVACTGYDDRLVLQEPSHSQSSQFLRRRVLKRPFRTAATHPDRSRRLDPVGEHVLA